MSNLEQWKDKKVEELITRPPLILSNEEKERRQIYSSLLFAITAYYFNGNKYGDEHQYPLNPTGSKTDAYLGHNIAGIAVDQSGEVMDFEFNHNRLFNSSVEHAESRLIRRVFSLSQVYNSWKDDAAQSPTQKYGNLLSEASVYTTLESCTQCTGIMTLGDVKNIVYLQDDPGMYHIGNIVKNLTDGQGFIEAPLPISGEEIGFDWYNEMNTGYIAFQQQQQSEAGSPFVIYSDGKKHYTSSITSFLCTNVAYDIFAKGLKQLNDFVLQHSDFRPHDNAMTNREVLEECRGFYEYATLQGKRGTPHRM